MAKTTPSKSICFPRAEKEKYLKKCDEMTELFAEHGITGFSAAIRQVLDGHVVEVAGKKMWVVSLE